MKNQLADNRQSVLLVDDDQGLLKLLSMRIEAAGYRVLTAQSAEEGINLVRFQSPDIVVTDLKMGGMDGIELFAECQKIRPLLPFIIITAHGTIPDAVDATQRGVYSFIPKPIDSQILIDTVKRALATHSPIPRDSTLAGQHDSHGIITRNPQVLDLIRHAEKIASCDHSVIIQGSCGTGKDTFARAIHHASKRKDKPFVTVNCGTIGESDLCGYEMRAFENADKDCEGLIQQANGGTLFLDAIGEMSLPMQATLLRILQEGKVKAIGAATSSDINIRIVSATDFDLFDAVNSREFREDLYFRLNVMSLTLPTLSERRDDIALLADHFLSLAPSNHSTNPHTLSSDALQYLKEADWPGNIRQLENTINQLVTLSPSPVIAKALVQQLISGNSSEAQSFTDGRNDWERNYLIRIIAEEGGNITRAARKAKRNRTDFYKLLAKHTISPAAYKKSTSSDDQFIPR